MIWDRFWQWYNRHYAVTVTVSAFLFTLQLIHLYWLTAHVVAVRLVGHSFFPVHGIWQTLLILVDYTEIPALLSVSLVYVNQFRQGGGWKNILFLVFLNSQWLHMFWITDEFVLEKFVVGAGASILPTWLAWVAICIDYLELPVMFDTLGKFWRGVRTGQWGEAAAALKE